MNSGFTLIELLVVIVIMGIFTVAIAVAYPNARAEQKLTLAEQTFQAALREAQQLAINEDRADNCAGPNGPFANDPADQRLCSDIGVYLDVTTNEFIVFADTSNPDDNQWNSGNDIERKRIPFPEGVHVSATTATKTFIFQGTPPTVSLFTRAGRKPTVNPEIVIFEVGTHTRQLNVLSYGQVEREKH